MDEQLLEPGWRARRVDVGEVALHVVEAGPESGPAVILLHGFPEFWWGWRKLISPLAAIGCRVIVPDLRGYNHSDRPNGVRAYRTDRLAGDVAGLIDALGLGRVRLVGHDWGGLVAWATAALHAERIEQLVIMDAPHPEAWAGFMLRHPTQALRSAYVGWFQLPLAPEAMLRAADFALLRSTMQGSARAGLFTTAELDAYAEAWRRPGALTAMLNYYRALARPSAPKIGRIAPPTLILWGDRDSFLDNGLAQASADRCVSARVQIVEGATHWLHLEQPERVAAELAGFFG
jgi:pimeloyl-ACP methyl ester carboxylesterase